MVNKVGRRMKKLLNDILKEKEGNTYDIAKCLWVLGVVAYLFLSIVSVFKNQPWEPAQYGIGFGAVLAGGGASMSLKKESQIKKPSS